MNKGRKRQLAYWGVMEMKGTNKQRERKMHVPIWDRHRNMADKTYSSQQLFFYALDRVLKQTHRKSLALVKHTSTCKEGRYVECGRYQG